MYELDSEGMLVVGEGRLAAGLEIDLDRTAEDRPVLRIISDDTFELKTLPVHSFTVNGQQYGLRILAHDIYDLLPP